MRGRPSRFRMTPQSVDEPLRGLSVSGKGSMNPSLITMEYPHLVRRMMDLYCEIFYESLGRRIRIYNQRTEDIKTAKHYKLFSSIIDKCQGASIPPLDFIRLATPIVIHHAHGVGALRYPSTWAEVAKVRERYRNSTITYQTKADVVKHDIYETQFRWVIDRSLFETAEDTLLANWKTYSIHWLIADPLFVLMVNTGVVAETELSAELLALGEQCRKDPQYQEWLVKVRHDYATTAVA